MLLLQTHMDEGNLELIIRAETLYDGIQSQSYVDQVKLIGILSSMLSLRFGVGLATSNLIGDEVELFLRTNINTHSTGIKGSMFEPPCEN